MTDTESQPRAGMGAEILRLGLCCLAILVLLCLFAYLSNGKTGIEKTLTKLAFPVGAAWWLLSGYTLRIWLSGRVRRAMLLSAGWLLFSLCSSAYVVMHFTKYLEGSVATYDPNSSEPLDAIVVLGGGTSTGPTRAQAGVSGDRVVYAAQLYVQGHTKHLITTGTTTPAQGKERRSPSDHTLEIWTQLGIPREAISIVDGINTYQEIQGLEARMRDDLAGKRIGLLTSATHLPRALRLARAAGLDDIVGIAADHRWSDEPATFDTYLPNADALAQFARNQKELMARLVNR